MCTALCGKGSGETVFRERGELFTVQIKKVGLVFRGNIQIHTIYSLTKVSIEQLLLKDISHHISQLHVSAHFCGAIFRLSF